MHQTMRTLPERPALPPLLLLCLALLLAITPARAASGKLADTELVGETYRSFELIAPVPDFCRKVCERDEGCEAWTFAWPGKKGKRAKCLLKRKVTEKRQDTCCISGYRPKGGTATATATRKQEAPSGGKAAAPAAEMGGAGSGDDDNAAGSRAAAGKPAARPDTARSSGSGTRVSSSASAADDSLAGADDPALAEKRLFCQRYAALARQANEQAQARGCDVRGGLWGARYEAYFNSCMKKRPEVAERNTKLRALALQRCARAQARRQPDVLDGPPPFPPPSSPPDAAPWPERRPPAAGTLQRRAPFLYSWLKRSGPGPRATLWRPSLSGKCPLTRRCDCPQGNSCRVYDAGEMAIYWPLGCNGPPATVVCRVRRR